jgi:3-oxoacyl-[acyl-carrier protein] reductase
MAETDEFKGQVAAVTGGAVGIGFAICKLLAQRGAQVCILDLDEGKAVEAAKKLGEWGLEGRAYKVDVTKENTIQAARDAILKDFGHVEVLVNNAGIYPQASLREITIEGWDQMFDVNAKSVLLTTRTFMDPMIEKKYGRIVTIGTIDAYNPKPTTPHYAASKAAVLSLIKTFAAELAPHQVLCNGVSPGAVATERAKASDWLPKRLPLIPLGRAAEPEDMAEYVVFLASNRNRFMTGETVIASGGFTMI